MAKRKSTKRHGTKKRRRVGSTNPSVVSGIGKRRRSRRRRVGAITGSDAGDALLGTAIGAGASILINKVIPANDKAKALAELAIGTTLVVVGAKKKKYLMAGAGAGMAIVGAMGTARSFGMIEGMEDIMSGLGFTEEIQGVGAGKEDTMLIEINGVSGEEIENRLNGATPPVVSGSEDSNSNAIYNGVGGNPAVVS